MEIKSNGITRCSEILTDNLGHLYNGKYMDIIIKIIRKEKEIYSLIKEVLALPTILLERISYKEDFSFKKEVKKGDIKYEILTLQKENTAILQGRFFQEEKLTTNFTISFNPKSEGLRKDSLEIVSQKRDIHELTCTCIAGMLSVPTIKGILEVERGRFLSLITIGIENYYGMMKEKRIAFISSKSEFLYRTALFPGELYTIETFLPERIMEKEVIKIPFYQEIRDKNGEIVATSENTMVKINMEDKHLKKTMLKKL